MRSIGLRRLGLLALLGAAPFFFPARAGAVQIFIESAFVHRNNKDCIAENVPGGVVRFRCPPIPPNVTCPASVTGVCTGGGVGSKDPSIGPCDPNDGTNVCGAGKSGYGNISNDPHIEFDRPQDAFIGGSSCEGRHIGTAPGASPFPLGSLYTNYCNENVFLCGAVGYGTADTSADLAIDQIQFEIFKFQDGSNPLDPGSTPPLRTFFVDAPGSLPGNQGALNNTLCGGSGNANSTSENCGPMGPFCVLWDGAVNIQGGFGKTNGIYGFRVQTQTNQTGASGNVQITAVRAYPSGATRNADFAAADGCDTAKGCLVPQQPITVDVTNVHVIRSSPTLTGSITPVPSEPYNIFYRLSKDATMTITINSVDADGTLHPIRQVLTGQTRVGEGVPNGSLSNGDSWNGREDDGDFAPPGNYLVQFSAISNDQFGPDQSNTQTLGIGLDPLQITDIRVQPLLDGATSLAVLDYVLTEPATVYVDVYPPGTQFCNLGTDVNLMNISSLSDGSSPPKDFEASVTGCNGSNANAPVNPVRHIMEIKQPRQRVITFWDGRDGSGNIVQDGDYIFLIYAAMPSRHGSAFNATGAGSGGKACTGSDCRIWTSIAKSGFVSVIRGFVAISQVTPATSVMGSSPSVAGLNPFLFRYSLSRDALVTLNIRDTAGNLVKTLVNNQLRPGLFGNVERWDDGKDNNGLLVGPGTYMAELLAADPLQPAKVSTTTAFFPVDLLRITDVQSTPLLSGASDLLTVSYQLSQPMNVWLNIYPPGTVIKNTGTNWPPCAPTFPTPVPCNDIVDSGGTPNFPVVQIHGYRSGRLKITEQWDGRDNNGLLVPDGQYVYVLAAQSTMTVEGGVSTFPQDRTFGTLTIQRGQILFPNFSVVPDVPTLFNSSNTITLHPFTIQYSLTRQSSTTIQVLDTALPVPHVLRTVIAGEVRQNGVLLTDIWDGRDDKGNFLPSGFYIVRAIANDLASPLGSGSTAQVTISYDPIRIYDVAVSPVDNATGGSTIFYQVSEPMKVAVKIYRPGTFFDVNGNPSPPESISLVKRIVGVKPARVQIEDLWDGTDLRLSRVPDGTYKFKIVGSTDVRAIDDLTGDVLNSSALSLDRPVDDIPVVRGASTDPQADFEENTFVYPNPVTTKNATFQIYVPFQGDVKLRLYNIAGELVLEKDFGEQAPSYTAAGPLSWVWNRVNQSGRDVARGLYFVVIRAEETIGGKEVLQTTKKVLIP